MRSRNGFPLPIIGLGVALLAYFLLFWEKPWHHVFTYGGSAALFVQPIDWLFVVLFCVALVWLFFHAMESRFDRAWHGWAVFFSLTVIGLSYWYWSVNTYGKAIANSYTYTEIPALENTNIIRWTAYDIGETGIESYNNSAVWDSGDIDPHPIGNEFVWQAPRIPLGINNNLNAQSNRVFIFHEDETITHHDQSFACGEGMWFGNSIDWSLRRFKYDATYTEHLYWRVGEEYFIVSPYIEWEWDFPVRYPVWGGVMLTDSNCNITPLTPEQAQADPRLDGLQIFPEKLAEYQVNAWHYKWGNSLAPILTKKEVYDIPRLSDTGNQQPYLLSTTGLGTSWTFMTDPTGNGDSLARVFYFNAETGFLSTVNISANYTDSFVGLQQGALMARNAYPAFSWDAVEGFVIIESLPVVKNNVPYWQYTITNAEKKDTVGVVVVNMRKAANEVVAFCSADSMKAWLNNTGGSDALPCPQNTGPTIIVEETLPEGSVQNPAIDPSQYTDEELLDMIRRFLDELERRSKDAIDAIFYWK